VELDYDNLPAFSKNSKMVGHNIEKCRRLKEPEVEKKDNEPNPGDERDKNGLRQPQKFK
jgi:hypothetical protein